MRRLPPDRMFNLIEAVIIEENTRRESEYRVNTVDMIKKHAISHAPVRYNGDDINLFGHGENKPPIPEETFFDPAVGFGDFRPLN